MENGTGAYTILGEKQQTPTVTAYIAHPENRENRKVILKIFHNLRNDAGSEWNHIWEQAQKIQQLQYPLIVPIVDTGTIDHQLYITIAYRSAGSLRTTLKGPRLDPVHALSIVSQIGHALIYAHQHDIMHINLKPENVLFSQKGQAQLTDFALPPYNPLSNRPTESPFADFSYYAPEVFIGQPGPLSDQYALGCLMYDLVTGTTPPPSERTSLSCLIKQYRQTETLASHFPDLSENITQAIQRSMREIAEQRYPNMIAFIQIIDQYLSVQDTSLAPKTGASEATKTTQPAIKENPPKEIQTFSKPQAFSKLQTLSKPHTSSDPQTLSKPHTSSDPQISSKPQSDLVALNSLLQDTAQPSIYDAIFSGDDDNSSENPPDEEPQTYPVIPVPHQPASPPIILPLVSESDAFNIAHFPLIRVNDPPLAAYTLKPNAQPSIYDSLAEFSDDATSDHLSKASSDAAGTPKKSDKPDATSGKHSSHHTLDEDDHTNLSAYTLNQLSKTYADEMFMSTSINNPPSENVPDPNSGSQAKKKSEFNRFFDQEGDSPPLAAYTLGHTNVTPYPTTPDKRWPASDSTLDDYQNTERPARPPHKKATQPAPEDSSQNPTPDHGPNFEPLLRKKMPRPTAPERPPHKKMPRPTSNDIPPHSP